ncbi:MAG: hypothetical protein KIS76_05975 [Pyrinomonadaceae bacterium]|nr:hypothetical protein [Pyrinomonadaceae bacterium]
MLANGDIGDIIVLSRSDKEFTRSCIEAVKKIRFIPVQLDGKNVDSFQNTSFMATFNSISPMLIRR